MFRRRAGAVAAAVLGDVVAVTTVVLGILPQAMLNFIALYLMNFLIFGSVSFWRDRQNFGYPSGKLIPHAAQLPNIWLRLHLGIVIAILVAGALWWWLRSSRWGFDLRVIGDSVSAASDRLSSGNCSAAWRITEAARAWAYCT